MDNKYLNLKIKDFASDEDFIETILKVKDFADDKTISVYANSEYMSYLMRELLYMYDCEVGSIDLDCGIYDECYDSEYLLEIDCYLNICIEKAWNDGKLVMNDSFVSYVHQDYASQELIEALLDRYENTVLFGVCDNYTCNGDCASCDNYVEEKEETTHCKSESVDDYLKNHADKDEDKKEYNEQEYVHFVTPDKVLSSSLYKDMVKFEKMYDEFHEMMNKLFDKNINK